MTKYILYVFLLVAFVGNANCIKCYQCFHFALPVFGNFGSDETCKNGETPKTVVTCGAPGTKSLIRYHNQSDEDVLATKQVNNWSWSCLKVTGNVKHNGENHKFVGRDCFPIAKGQEKDKCTQDNILDLVNLDDDLEDIIFDLVFKESDQTTHCVCNKDMCNSGISVSFSAFTMLISLIFLAVNFI